jgi:hypothetical protein
MINKIPPELLKELLENAALLAKWGPLSRSLMDKNAKL